MASLYNIYGVQCFEFAEDPSLSKLKTKIYDPIGSYVENVPEYVCSHGI